MPGHPAPADLAIPEHAEGPRRLDFRRTNGRDTPPLLNGFPYEPNQPLHGVA